MGLAFLRAFILSLEEWRKLRLIVCGLTGLGLVRLALVNLAGDALLESPAGRIFSQIPVRGSRRNPSPLGPPPRNDGGDGRAEEALVFLGLPNLRQGPESKGTRGEPLALNFPKRAARANPPRRSGLKAHGPNRPWSKPRCCHEAGPLPPSGERDLPLKRGSRGGGRTEAKLRSRM